MKKISSVTYVFRFCLDYLLMEDLISSTPETFRMHIWKSQVAFQLESFGLNSSKTAPTLIIWLRSIKENINVEISRTRFLFVFNFCNQNYIFQLLSLDGHNR